jgi:O-antigen ligase
MSAIAPPSRVPLWTEIGAGLLILAAVVFGGASGDNLLRQGAVELISVPVFSGAAWTLWRSGRLAHHRRALALVALIPLVPLLHLAPLPPAIWQALPGREPLVEALALAGMAHRWMPMTVTPEQTWLSLLFLFPPFAILLSVAAASETQRWRLAVVAVATALLAAVWAAAQVASGSDPALLAHQTIHGYLPIGPFSNRNHQAMLMVVGAALAGVWPATIAARSRAAGPGELVVGTVLLAIFCVAGLATQSRAGVAGLAIVAAGCVAMVALAAPPSRRRRGPLIAVGGVLATGLGVAVLVGMQALQSRFAMLAEREGRMEFWPDIVTAGLAYQPFGAGIGAFETVFIQAEPLDRMRTVYIDQAHNDFLELWVDAGWPGILVAVIVLAFLARRMVGVWVASGREAGGGADNLARAGSLICLVLILHSAVDYPLGVEALAVMFALGAGLVLFGGAGEAASQPSRSRRRRRRSRPDSEQAAPEPAPDGAKAASPAS